MHISALKQSKFLTRADVGRGILVSIKEIYQDNVAKEGAPEELRWCISFNEAEKPMVLNSTNGQIIAGIVKSEETDHWVGKQVVLYDDPNVSFGGKLVGGIRVRAPRVQAAPVAPRAGVVQHKPTPAPAHVQPQLAPEENLSEPPEVGSDTPF